MGLIKKLVKTYNDVQREIAVREQVEKSKQISAEREAINKEHTVCDLHDFVFSKKKVSVKLLNDMDLCSLQFEQEKDNEYDPNAVKVLFEDQLIGYLYKGDLQDKVNEWIDKGLYIKNVCHIEIDYDDDKDKYFYNGDIDDYDCKLVSIDATFFDISKEEYVELMKKVVDK